MGAIQEFFEQETGETLRIVANHSAFFEEIIENDATGSIPAASSGLGMWHGSVRGKPNDFRAGQ